MSLSEGEKFIEMLNDHHLEQLVHFPTREKNTLDSIITSLPSQFLDIQSPARLSDHEIVSGTLKIVIPHIKIPRRKVYRYQKGDYKSMRSDALRFAKERYFNGYSDSRSVQENFNLITFFIQDSADKHMLNQNKIQLRYLEKFRFQHILMVSWAGLGLSYTTVKFAWMN